MTVLSFATLSPAALFFALVVGHLIGDYPLQGDFLARAKNHKAPLPGVPAIVALLSHAGIQAGITAAITGSATIGALEYFVHSLIDYAKCEGWLGTGEHAFTIDQFLHVACKLFWVTAIRGSW